MIRTSALLVAISTCAALAGCAAPSPQASAAIGQSEAQQCFLANEVRGYQAAADGLVNLRVGADRWFQMRLNSDCPSMDWLMQIAVRPRDSNWLCEGQSSYLIAPSPVGMNRACRVTEIRRLGPGEVGTALSLDVPARVTRGE